MAGGKRDPINELSQKMLAGWAMLAESCTLGCNVPLVENKKQQKIVCVSCDRQFKRDLDEGNDLKPIPQESLAPIVSSSGTASTSTATADTFVDINSYEDESSEVYVPPTDEELEKHEERRKRNEKASVEIGVKLLAGWTMLDLHCPNPSCRTVLMKDKQNHKWCLACGTMVVTQEEFDATKHISVSSTSAPASMSNTPKISSVEPEHHKTPSTQVQPQKESWRPPPQSLLPSKSPQVRAVNSVGQALQNINHGTPLQQSFHPVFAQPITYPTQNQIIENSLQNLYQKLNEYTRLLSITSDILFTIQYGCAR
jgi:uncharacterized Zn finger protein (UPF0148 family)